MNPSSAQTLPTVLDPEQTARIVTAVDGLTPEQLHWLSGYAAGLAARDTGSAVPLDSAAPIDKGHASSEAPSLTVLYGSQTGNGKRVAEELAAGARHKGYEVKLRSLADYRPAQLRKESLVSLVVSTHGEGDPPDDAEPFHEYLMSDKAPSLAQLKFSVLALGDSSYVNFCETGRELDRRLAELGAERVVSMVECDVDFATPAAGWSQSVLDGLPELLGKASAQPQLHAVPSVASAEVYDKHRPFEAEVLPNQPITTSAAGRDVRHIELSIEGSGIRYEPGDSLAVLVSNPPALVAEFLEVLGLDGIRDPIVYCFGDGLFSGGRQDATDRLVLDRQDDVLCAEHLAQVPEGLLRPDRALGRVLGVGRDVGAHGGADTLPIMTIRPRRDVARDCHEFAMS